MDVTARWLDVEHRELDHALAEVEFLAERRAFDPAARRFHEFRERFLAHLETEEADPKVAEVVKPAHARLLAALDAVTSALDRHDYAEFSSGVTALGKLVAAHERDEEALAR
ncbi:MAG: hypothetical protein JNK82_12335 [Myxococcaceae bacterium]|nr:hypothetical protein [Myxococcaceae bacterium]